MRISILGCGWLGFPLAKKLIQNGYKVKGSTTSENKLNVLQSHTIEPFLITLSENKIEGNITEFLNHSGVLVIDIPPKLRRENSENFVRKIENLLPFIEKSSIKNVIFISSTSVYGDSTSIPSITEESDVNPDTESGKQLVEAENLLRNNTNFKTTIIRFGGLIGEDRNPTKFLAGKTDIANPEAPINFIHQEDCIGIIEKMLKRHFDTSSKHSTGSLSVTQQSNFEVFNAVSPFHPTRKEYYTEKAFVLKLPIPIFNETEPSVGKIISSEKIEMVLGYNFRNPNLR